MNVEPSGTPFRQESPSDDAIAVDDRAIQAAEIAADDVDTDLKNRLWLKAVVPLLQLRSHESDPSTRVQLAFDLMYIAACERVARIFRSDLPSDRG
jgi:hypothetical protein